MKNTALFILSILMLTSCATTKKQEEPRFPNLTIEKVQKECRPAEMWRVSVLGVPATVLRFDSCLSVDHLLLVGMNTDNATPAIRNTSVDLLVLHYMEHTKRLETENKTGKVWSKTKIKQTESEGWLSRFVELKFKTIKCTDTTCKEVDKP